jgi:hypothetical protein
MNTYKASVFQKAFKYLLPGFTCSAHEQYFLHHHKGLADHNTFDEPDSSIRNVFEVVMLTDRKRIDL